MEVRSHALPILLASSSPRRRELLAGLGLHFTIQSSRVEEEIDPHLSPGEMVERLALMKAKEVASSHPDSLVIGSDTLVVAEGKALGKPKDEAEAFRMLGFLQGKVHTVYTGIALVHAASGKEQIRHSSTRVKMRPLSEAEIDDYIATGEPMDKAGGYDTTMHLGDIGQYRIISESPSGEPEIIVGHTVSKVTFRPMSDAEIEAYIKTGDPLDKAGAYGVQGIGAVFIEKIEGDFYSIMGLPLNLLYQMLLRFGVSPFKTD
ncbi:Maf family protein [Thermicanus aegyptius]|uniref:Maf family protein n=1 Tax=Thermicanus aegyptius TaxID=94009 RepID=UPI000429B4C9|nr:Maf family protein [Thermicanus aegyptius]